MASTGLGWVKKCVFVNTVMNSRFPQTTGMSINTSATAYFSRTLFYAINYLLSQLVRQSASQSSQSASELVSQLVGQ